MDNPACIPSRRILIVEEPGRRSSRVLRGEEEVDAIWYPISITKVATVVHVVPLAGAQGPSPPPPPSPPSDQDEPRVRPGFTRGQSSRCPDGGANSV